MARLYGQKSSRIFLNIDGAIIGDIWIRGIGGNQKHPEKPQVRRLLQSQDIKHIAKKILKALGEKEPEVVLGAAKRRSKRNTDMAIYDLGYLGMLTNKEIGQIFAVGYTAVTESAKHAAFNMTKGRNLQERINQISIDIWRCDSNNSLLAV